MNKPGDPYKTSGFDSIFFHIYTHVQLSPVKCGRHKLTVDFLDTTAGAGRPLDPTTAKHNINIGSIVCSALVLVTRWILKNVPGMTASFGKGIAREEIKRLKIIVLRESEHNTEELRRIPVKIGNTPTQRCQAQIMQFSQT